MKDQLIEAWRTSNRISLVFIDHIPDEGMQKTLSTRGGRTVFQQFIHLHQVRLQWLEICSGDIFRNHSWLDKSLLTDKKALKASFLESGKAIEELIHKSWNEGGKIKSFSKGLITFLSYFIAHEAHHRGNILLTLKQSGIPITEPLKWQIWDWNKI